MEKIATVAAPTQVIRNAPPRRGPQQSQIPVRHPGAAAADDLHRALAGWTLMLGQQPVDPTRGRR